MDRRSFCQQLVGTGFFVGSLTTLAQADMPRLSPKSGSKLKWQYNLKSAQKLALQQDKPMMIVFCATWCKPCQKLQRETFTDKAVMGIIEREFIPVHLDADKDPKVAKILEVELLPCIIFLTPDADLLLKTEGFATAKDFQLTLASALEKRTDVQQVNDSTNRR